MVLITTKFTIKDKSYQMKVVIPVSQKYQLLNIKILVSKTPFPILKVSQIISNMRYQNMEITNLRINQNTINQNTMSLNTTLHRNPTIMNHINHLRNQTLNHPAISHTNHQRNPISNHQEYHSTKVPAEVRTKKY